MGEEGLQAAAQWTRRIPNALERDLAAGHLAELYQPGDSSPGRAFLEAARTAPPAGVAGVAMLAASSAGEIELAMRLLDIVAERDTEISYEPIARAVMLAGTGRPDSAGRWLQHVTDPSTRAAMTAVLAVAPFMPIESLDVDRARETLAGGRGSVAGQLGSLYLRALLDARLGDEAAALRAADSLDAAADTLPLARQASVDLWARSIRATLAIERGDADAALNALGPVDGPITTEDAASLLHDRTRERYLLGSLLVEAGRPDEAVPWLRYGIPGGYAGILYVPMSHLRLGQAHEMAGRPADAARAYGRFLRYFAHAEPSMRPHVESARSALARLTREAGD